jgi:outer membrane receptor protein involved in Fe transport
VDVDALRIHTDVATNYIPNQSLNPQTGSRTKVVVPGLFQDHNMATSQDYGASIQDLIAINSRWHVLLGGRFERNLVDVTQKPVGAPAPASTSNQYSGFVPRVGVLYQVKDNLSLYASYMGSYQSPGADYGVWDIPSNLKPERAFQTEAGVKVELLDKRLLLTTSVFSIKKHDVISTEPNPAGGPPYTLYFNIGKEDAHGADIDIVGELSKNLRIATAFNVQTMVFTNPKKLIVDGKHRYGTPTYSGSLWAVYEFSSGSLKGLGMGGGVATRSSVFANDANEAKVPSYTTFDAVAYYHFSKVRLQANLYNIGNTLGYNVSGIGGTGNPTNMFLVMPLAPFRVSLSASYTF